MKGLQQAILNCYVVPVLNNYAIKQSCCFTKAFFFPWIKRNGLKTLRNRFTYNPITRLLLQIVTARGSSAISQSRFYRAAVSVESHLFVRLKKHDERNRFFFREINSPLLGQL